MRVTQGFLLGGRVRYAQPAEGFRSGIEPVLLAASVPARPTERVLEAGSGAGAALLCIAARVPGIAGIGVDRDSTQTHLAQQNAGANWWPDLHFVTADVSALPLTGPFEHAFANPPYHPDDGTASPDQRRELAKRATGDLLSTWARALSSALRHRGTLTLIVAGAMLSNCLASMHAANCPADTIFPLWPKPSRPAGLVLVRGVKGGRGSLRMLPGLILHEPNGGYTEAAEAILRGGNALDMTS